VRRVALAILIAGTLGSSPATAAEPATTVLLQDGINEDGTGHLLANAVPDGSWGSLAWQACGPDGACTPVQPSGSSANVLDVGAAPAGTTFVATASDGTRPVSATSAPYRGRLVLFSPPYVVGAVRTGHFVMPRPATWFGGWGDERPLLQLQACRTRRGGCKVISSTYGWNRCPGTGARIAPRYRGWYLRVAEAHLGGDVVFAQRAYTRPEDIEPMTASAVTAVAIVGRIATGRGPHRRC
jgi:hypothetical protein